VLTTEPCNESEVATVVWEVAPCPSAAEVSEIERDIPITIEEDASAGSLACTAAKGSADLTRVHAKVLQALVFLKSLHFDEPLPWTENSVYDWLRTTIPRGMVVLGHGNSHSCLKCQGPIYIVLPDDQPNAGYPQSVTTTPYEVIVHEARHADGWDHTCGSEPKWNRDKTIGEMGAFGVQYYLNRWIQLHSGQGLTLRGYSQARAAQLRQRSGAFCCECSGQTGTNTNTSAGGCTVAPPLLFLAPRTGWPRGAGELQTARTSG
jgi:hypothetical protein